jgi:large subunit ribosomal protein L10
LTPVAEKEPRPEKVQEVEELQQLIAECSTAILADFRGLGVKDMAALRRRLRETGTRFRVVKNTLFKRAAAGTAYEALVAGLEGPTAVAATEGDPVAAAKALFGYIREARSPMTVKGAIVDGQILDAKSATALSTMPGKQELLGMVVGGLQSPITGLVGTLNQLIVQAVMVLQAIADKQEAAA